MAKTNSNPHPGATNALILTRMLPRFDACTVLFQRATIEVREKITRIKTAPERYRNKDESCLESAVDLEDSSKIARAIEDLQACQSCTHALIDDLRKLLQASA